jgi:hypothetical protein
MPLERLVHGVVSDTHCARVPCDNALHASYRGPSTSEDLVYLAKEDSMEIVDTFCHQEILM